MEKWKSSSSQTNGAFWSVLETHMHSAQLFMWSQFTWKRLLHENSDFHIEANKSDLVVRAIQPNNFTQNSLMDKSLLAQTHNPFKYVLK